MVKKQQKLEACLDVVLQNYMKISTHCATKGKKNGTPYAAMCPECRKSFSVMRGAFIRAWEKRNTKGLPPFIRKNIKFNIKNYLDGIKFELSFDLAFESDFTITYDQLSCAAEEFSDKRKKRDAYKKRTTSQTSEFFPRDSTPPLDSPS